jgi:hypothetical protein
LASKQHSKDDLVSFMKTLAQENASRSIARHEFLRRFDVSERTIAKLFGSYNGLVRAAGLDAMNFPSPDAPTYGDADLLAELIRVLRLPNSKMTRIFFEQHARVSASACERRFGGWLNAVREAARLLDPRADRELVSRIREYTEPRLTQNANAQAATVSVPPATSTASRDSGPSPESSAIAPPFDGANVYGDFINFRGLQHAPVNELGVVFLFGMICRELGYMVEIVKPGFPDCEAKRRIRSAPVRWQRVRIEFEYESRSFRAHGHDPDLCDVIVCWMHNWPDCPIEVLELRSVLEKLSSRVE